MIKRLILNRLDAMERTLGESIDYMRHVVRVSLRAFLKFALFTPLAAHGLEAAAKSVSHCLLCGRAA
jgi:hypothetical protein